MKTICTKKKFCTVCSNDYGLCNVFGGVNCSSCGTVCRIGYEGNQCESCRKGFYVSNGVPNGEVDPLTGVGPICKGKKFLCCKDL